MWFLIFFLLKKVIRYGIIIININYLNHHFLGSLTQEAAGSHVTSIQKGERLFATKRMGIGNYNMVIPHRDNSGFYPQLIDFGFKQYSVPQANTGGESRGHSTTNKCNRSTHNQTPVITDDHKRNCSCSICINCILIFEYHKNYKRYDS